MNFDCGNNPLFDLQQLSEKKIAMVKRPITSMQEMVQHNSNMMGRRSPGAPLEYQLPVNYAYGFNGQSNERPAGLVGREADNMPWRQQLPVNYANANGRTDLNNLQSRGGNDPVYANSPYFELAQQQYQPVYTPVYFVQPNGLPNGVLPVVSPAPINPILTGGNNSTNSVINNETNNAYSLKNIFAAVDPAYKTICGALVLMIGTALVVKHFNKK